MIRSLLVMNVAFGTPAAAEAAMEAAFLRLPAQIPALRRYALGRNLHPMRPDLWMCTHVWETEFETLAAMTDYESHPSFRSLVDEYLPPEGDGIVDRTALIAYATRADHFAGDLLEPNRIRRLHLTTFRPGAPQSLRHTADEALLRMPGAIPEIKAWALGYNLASSELGIPLYDHSWDTAFESIRALQHYVTCDFHLNNTHDYAVSGSELHVYEELQSCLYRVELAMSG